MRRIICLFGFFPGGRAASQFTFPICRECARVAGGL